MDHLLQVRARVRNGLLSFKGVADVLAGNPDPGLYVRYLMNVWHYARHSATVIALAGARCVDADPKLAAYLMRHAEEELGHDQWALDDLAAFGVGEETVRESRPVPACAAMIGYEYYTAGHANPVGLFGWLYVLEAMGDDLGGLVSERLSGGLDLPDGVKFLAGHGVADEEHTREITEQITDNVRAADLPEIHFVAEVVGDLYVRMFEEIGEAGGP